MKAFRMWLAALIAPEMALEARMWRYAETQFRVAKTWIGGEFAQADAVLEWVFDGTRDFFRRLDEKARSRWSADIGRFRAELRKLGGAGGNG